MPFHPTYVYVLRDALGVYFLLLCRFCTTQRNTVVTRNHIGVMNIVISLPIFASRKNSSSIYVMNKLGNKRYELLDMLNNTECLFNISRPDTTFCSEVAWWLLFETFTDSSIFISVLRTTIYALLVWIYYWITLPECIAFSNVTGEGRYIVL